jgi:hypothetical protein
MIRHVLGPLLLVASALLLTGCKGVDHGKPPTRSTLPSQAGAHKFDGTYANPQWLG